MRIPSFDGSGLVNLMAELERRLTGQATETGLSPELSDQIPEAATYVLVLFDGLGDHQLSHPAASAFLACRRAAIDAPFPTTTTVSLATLSTGLTASSHGVITHLMWLPDVTQVVNVLKWVNLAGEHVDYPTTSFLPASNLWERLRRAGVEPITVQPMGFETTPLTKALYRGCRFEGYISQDGAIAATAELAAVPNRLILTYLPDVDFAAHVWGQDSEEYVDALGGVARVWEAIRLRMPSNAALIGTADHGVVDFPESAKQLIRSNLYDNLLFYGDPRVVMVKGDIELTEMLAEETGARVETGYRDWLGPGPTHPKLKGRLPDALLLAPDDGLLLPRGFDKRLRGYHGGLTDQEVKVPLLVG